jgi:hypothetical protein
MSRSAERTELGERFAAVDLQGHTGHERVRHREQHGAGDVLGVPDPSRGISGGDVFEVVPLAFCAKRIPGTGVDDTRRDGIDPDRGKLDRKPSGEEIDGAIGDADAEIADVDLKACTPENRTNDPPGLICPAKYLASIAGPMTLVSKDIRRFSRCRSAKFPRARADAVDTT